MEGETTGSVTARRLPRLFRGEKAKPRRHSRLCSAPLPTVTPTPRRALDRYAAPRPQSTTRPSHHPRCNHRVAQSPSPGATTASSNHHARRNDRVAQSQSPGATFLALAVPVTLISGANSSRSPPRVRFLHVSAAHSPPPPLPAVSSSRSPLDVPSTFRRHSLEPTSCDSQVRSRRCVIQP